MAATGNPVAVKKVPAKAKAASTTAAGKIAAVPSAGSGRVFKVRAVPKAKATDLAKSKSARSLFMLVSNDVGKVIEQTRRGIPSERLVDLTTALDIPRIRFFETMGLGRSTIEERIKKKELLTPVESDAVLRATKVFARATDVLEDEEAASKWMKREIRSIGGVSPFSLLDTETGYELVMDTLGRIEQGIAA